MTVQILVNNNKRYRLIKEVFLMNGLISVNLLPCFHNASIYLHLLYTYWNVDSNIQPGDEKTLPPLSDHFAFIYSVFVQIFLSAHP